MDLSLLKDLWNSMMNLCQRHDFKKHPSLVICIILGIIVLGIVFDNVLGYSYYYSNERKLEQLSKIQELKSYNNSCELHPFFRDKELEIINRKSVVKIFFSGLYKEIQTMNIVKFVHWLTSVGSIIVACFLFLVISIGVLFVDNKGKVVSCIIGGSITISLFLIAYLFQYLYTLIPNLGENRWLNYILQLAIQALIIILACRFFKTNLKSKRNEASRM